MLASFLKDGGLKARLLRSTGWTFIGFGTAQAVRLASNLLLTRLLFPEAFGLMAVITVFLVGLTMLLGIYGSSMYGGSLHSPMGKSSSRRVTDSVADCA